MTEDSEITSLSFAKAENQHGDESSPLLFETLEGGHFAVGSQYGTIPWKKFSLKYFTIILLKMYNDVLGI